jgi:hypothetical protein
MQRKLGNVDITGDTSLFQDGIAHESPPGSEKNKELMFHVPIVLKAFDLF